MSSPETTPRAITSERGQLVAWLQDRADGDPLLLAAAAEIEDLDAEVSELKQRLAKVRAQRDDECRGRSQLRAQVAKLEAAMRGDRADG